MNWKDIHEIYTVRSAHLLPKSIKNAEQGWEQLMEALPKLWPEAVEKPVLLIDAEYEELEPIFWEVGENGVRNLRMPQKALDAVWKLHRLRKKRFIANKGINQLDASKRYFHKLDVSWCMYKWLKTQGWQKIERSPNGSKTIDIGAEKDGKPHLFVAIGTLWREKEFRINERKNEEGRWDFELETRMVEDSVVQNQRLGRVLVYLLEQKIIDNSCQPAIMIADDKATRKAILPYAKYIKKLGIKVFMLRSAKQVEEL